MPYYCRSLVSQALNHGRQRSLSGAKVLVLGVAYKSDIGDTRESPALKLIELLAPPARRSRTTTRTSPSSPRPASAQCRSSPPITTASSSSPPGIGHDDVVEQSTWSSTSERHRSEQEGGEKVWKL